MSKNRFGFIAVLIGVVAFCLSVYLYEIRIDLESLRARSAPEKSSLTLKLGKHEIALGSRKEPVDKPGHDAVLQSKEKEVVAVRVGMISFAGLGLLLAPLAWIREKSRALSLVAGALPIAAVSWHFVMAGITLAVVIILLAGILSSLDISF